jgi:hypothetical protein
MISSPAAPNHPPRLYKSTILLNKGFRKYIAMVSSLLFCSPPRIDSRIHTNQETELVGEPAKPVPSRRGIHIEINEARAAIATCADVHCAFHVFFVPLPLL